MLELLKNPPNEYRPTPIWVWGSNPTPDEVERQIRDMHSKGIGGFFIHLPQHSHVREDHNECVLHAKKTAHELGMYFHIYEHESLKVSAKEAVGAVQYNSIFLDKLRHNTTNAHIGRGETEIDFSRAKQAQKLASSLVHTNGMGRVVSEIVGQADWSQSMKQIKQRVDLCASLGTNVFCPYPFNYSITDVLNASAPPSQFYQATYWQHYKLLSNYITRLGYTLSQGRHKAPVALLYPNKALQSDALTDEYFNVYAEYLIKEHMDYDVLDEETLQKASIIDQRLFVADEVYDLLIIPPITGIAYRTAVKIYEFGEDCGRIIGNVLLPFQDTGGNKHEDVAAIFSDLFDKDPAQLYQDYLKTEMPIEPDLVSTGSMLFINADNPLSIAPMMRSIVSTAVKPEVSLRCNGTECHDITYIHRVSDDSEIYFFSNNASEPREVQMTMRCNKAPYMLNLETGDATALPYCTQQGSRTILLHRFEEYGSLLVYFSDDPAFTIAQEIDMDGQDIPLSDEWIFSLEQPNCLSLHDWAFDTNKAMVAFNVETKSDQLLLVMKSMPVEVIVNGNKAVNIRPYALDVNLQSIDIAPFVQIGQNEIRLLLENNITTSESLLDLHGAMLIGNFSLDATNSTLIPLRKIIHSGSWTEQGYPFYSGTAVYRQTVMIPEFLRGQRVILQADNPADMVEFIVNGASAGVHPWAPYAQDITPLVKSGINEIEIKVTNSLANMLLSKPQCSGLLGGARLTIC